MTDDVHALERALSDASDEKRGHAAERLARLGTAAAPAALALVRAMADECENVREWSNAALEELGPPPAETAGELSRLLPHAGADVGYWAATLLGRLGEEASPHAQALLTRAEDESAPLAVRERCVWAAGRIGKLDDDLRRRLSELAADPRPRLARLARKALESAGG